MFWHFCHNAGHNLPRSNDFVANTGYKKERSIGLINVCFEVGLTTSVLSGSLLSLTVLAIKALLSCVLSFSTPAVWLSGSSFNFCRNVPESLVRSPSTWIVTLSPALTTVRPAVIAPLWVVDSHCNQFL